MDAPSPRTKTEKTSSLNYNFFTRMCLKSPSPTFSCSIHLCFKLRLKTVKLHPYPDVVGSGKLW
jgi:hypothetical protein